MTSYRTLARNRDFTRLWVGEAVSQLGTAASLFVFPLIGYALTGSALLAGLPVAAYTLGIALALLPAGVVADQLDRRRLLLAASATGLVLSGSLAVAGLVGAITMPHLVLVALGTGAVAGFYMPTEMSAVRSVVTREELPTAISQNQARHHIASLLGGPLGGVLYALGRPLPFLVDAVTFAVSLVTVSRVRGRPLPASTDRAARPVRELGDGLRYLLARPYFRATAAFSASLQPGRQRRVLRRRGAARRGRRPVDHDRRGRGAGRRGRHRGRADRAVRHRPDAHRPPHHVGRLDAGCRCWSR